MVERGRWRRAACAMRRNEKRRGVGRGHLEPDRGCEEEADEPTLDTFHLMRLGMQSGTTVRRSGGLQRWSSGGRKKVQESVATASSGSAKTPVPVNANTAVKKFCNRVLPARLVVPVAVVETVQAAKAQPRLPSGTEDTRFTGKRQKGRK